MPFEIVRNDITRMKVDAIVNAANRSLLGGGGVDGAIHKAAGPDLLAECRTLNGCEVGEAKLTLGYRLPARYVIHTVGPVWHGGHSGEREKLSACYRNSLQLAWEKGCESIAFPLISTGAYAYPKEEAMTVAEAAIRAFLDRHDMTVYLVIFGREALSLGKKLFRDVQEYIDDVYEKTHLGPKELSRRAAWLQEEEKALEVDKNLMAGAAEPLFDAEMAAPPRMPDWETLLRQTDEGFSEALLRLIDEKGMSDVECYKRANVDRKLFSKIRSRRDYRPSKETACAFAVALGLTLPEARALLEKAGFALSHSSKFDIIVEYCLAHRVLDVYEINEVLFAHDVPLLGSCGKLA